MSKDLSSNSKELSYIAILTSVQIFNILDVVIMLPLAPTFMRVFDISPAEFSFLASSYNLSAGTMGLLYSSVADKYNRKKLLIFLTLGLSLASTYCGFATSYYGLLIARILAGLFGGVINSVVYAIVADVIPQKRRGRAVGAIMASFSITSIVGIPIGLAIADYFDWRHTFHFIGIGALIVTFFSGFTLPSIPVQGTKLKVLENLKRVFAIAATKKNVLPFTVMALFTFSGFMMFPFLSPYAVKNIGLLESDLKYLYLVGGLFTIIASAITGRYSDKHGEFKAFIWPFIFSLPFIYLYTSIGPTPFPLLLVIASCFMIFINARFIPIMTLITKHPQETERGSFMGLLLSLRSFSSALAVIFTGLILVELPNGKLQKFNYIGQFSILLTIIGSFLFYRLYQSHYAKEYRAKEVNI